LPLFYSAAPKKLFLGRKNIGRDIPLPPKLRLCVERKRRERAIRKEKERWVKIAEGSKEKSRTGLAE
jgi:hypothetical protein